MISKLGPYNQINFLYYLILALGIPTVRPFTEISSCNVNGLNLSVTVVESIGSWPANKSGINIYFEVNSVLKTRLSRTMTQL